MKKIVILLLFVATQKISVAQNVGIGTTTTDSNAMLEIKSNDKGLLISVQELIKRNERLEKLIAHQQEVTEMLIRQIKEIKAKF